MTWETVEGTGRRIRMYSGKKFRHSKATGMFLGEVTLPKFFEKPDNTEARTREVNAGISNYWGTELDALNLQQLWKDWLGERMWSLEGSGGHLKAPVCWGRVFYPDGTVWEVWADANGAWEQVPAVDIDTEEPYTDPYMDEADRPRRDVF